MLWALCVFALEFCVFLFLFFSGVWGVRRCVDYDAGMARRWDERAIIGYRAAVDWLEVGDAASMQECERLWVYANRQRRVRDGERR